MGYRNENDALRAKVDKLEEELALLRGRKLAERGAKNWTGKVKRQSVLIALVAVFGTLGLGFCTVSVGLGTIFHYRSVTPSELVRDVHEMHESVRFRARLDPRGMRAIAPHAAAQAANGRSDEQADAVTGYLIPLAGHPNVLVYCERFECGERVFAEAERVHRHPEEAARFSRVERALHGTAYDGTELDQPDPDGGILWEVVPGEELRDYAASIGRAPDVLRVVVLDAESPDDTVFLAIIAVLLSLFAVFLSIAIFLHRRAAKRMVELPTPADLTSRDPAMTIVFSIVTCGLYELYWQYVTTRQLRRLTGRPDLQPVVDLLLSFVTLRLWTYWVAYRNAEAIDEAFSEVGEPTQHRTTALLLALGTLVCGLLHYAMIWKLQEAYNSFLIERILRDDALEPIPSSPEDGLL